MRQRLLRRTSGAFVIIAFWLGLIGNAVWPQLAYPSQVPIDTLLLPGMVIDCVARDLDGDKKAEIAVFLIADWRPSGSAFQATVTSPKARRLVCLFKMQQDRYSSQPQQMFEVPDEAVFYDLADIDGDHLIDLLFLNTSEVVVHRWQDGRWLVVPQVVLKTKSWPGLARQLDISHWDFVLPDRIGPGQWLIVTPSPSGFDIWQKDKQGFIISQSLEYDHALVGSVAQATADALGGRRHGPVLWLNYVVPGVVWADYDGDRMDDLFIAGESEVAVYKRYLGGHFSTEPTILFVADSPALLRDRSRYVPAFCEITDINGDGLADIALARGGPLREQFPVGYYHSRVQIFRGRQVGGYGSRPNFEFASDDKSADFLLRDLNGDGRLDLILCSLRFGVVSAMKVLLTEKIDAQVSVYLQAGDDNFPPKPDWERTFTYSTVMGENIHWPDLVNCDGDFDGDGRVDLLCYNGEGGFSAYLCQGKKELFGPRPLTIEVPRPEWYTVCDVDSDGSTEIVMVYSTQETGSLGVVWISRGR